MDQYDKYLPEVRAEIERRVAAVNAEHKARYAEFPEDCADCSVILADELRAVYAWADKNNRAVKVDDDA